MSTFDVPFFRIETQPFEGKTPYAAQVSAFTFKDVQAADDPTFSVLLDEQELEDMRDAIAAALDEIRNSGFVQVRFNGSSRLYTYRDPSGELQPGDWVVVPTYMGTSEQIVQVAARGRGSYTGDVFSEVKSRLVERPL